MTENRRTTQIVENTGQSAVFFLLAYIGAAIYFVSRSDGSFWGVVLGIFQGFVWPVYVTYHVLDLLGV